MMIGNSSVIAASNIIKKNSRALNIEDISKYSKQMAHLTIQSTESYLHIIQKQKKIITERKTE
jgi:hypothetical protein